MPDTIPIDEDHAEFMTRGVSICVASCSPARVPSVARAVGIRVSPDRRRVTVLVSATQAATLLADVDATRRIAVTCVEPSSHRAMQLKGGDAARGSVQEDDLAMLTAHATRFVAEVQPLGFEPDLIARIITCPPDDVVAIDFTVDAVFVQTPGPRAGELLRARA